MSIDRSDGLALNRRQLLLRAGASGAVLSLPGLLAACGGGNTTTASQTAAGGSPASGTELTADRMTWALGSGLSSLDWQTDFSAGTWVNLTNALESPLRFRTDGSTEPCLAESVDQPDERTFVLKLRLGVTFWDGSKLTPEDVVASLMRNITQKTSAGATYYGSVKSVRKTGANEVTISLSQVDPLFQYVLAHPATFITSANYLSRAGRAFGTAKAPGMGTGAMKIDKFNPRTGMALSRFDGYWGDRSTIGTWETKFITDTQARLLALQSGEIDGCQDVPADSIETWQQAGSIGGPLEGYLFFGWSFPTKDKPFDDVHVRRAFAYATDGPGLAKASGGPGADPWTYLVQPQALQQLASKSEIDALFADMAQYPFDMDRARQELQQSSVPDGFTATVVFPNTFPQLEAIALNTAQNLKQIGITLKVQQGPEENVIPEKWLGLPPNDAHKDSGLLVRLYYGAPLPDPGDTLAQSLSAASIPPGGQNSARYDNPKVQSLLKQAGSTTDKATRFKAFSEVLNIVADEVPYAGAIFAGSPWIVRNPMSWDPQATNPYLVLRPWFRDLRG